MVDEDKAIEVAAAEVITPSSGFGDSRGVAVPERAERREARW